MGQGRPDMTGKTALITGASGGLGKETARVLAGLGAHVILVCRDRERGERARADIRAGSGNAAVDVMPADLASPRDIRRLASDVRACHPRLHVLVNNAAGASRTRRITADGLEMTFAVNHLAYVQLTCLLLDVLTTSAPARVVNVSSRAHETGTIDFDDLQMERGYDGFRAYCNSKLANVLFTYELARRLARTGVTANCLHPGDAATGIFRDYPWFIRLYARAFYKRPAAVAASTIYLAASPDVEGVSGKYFVGAREARSSAASHDEAVAGRLWDVSARLAGL